MNNIPALTAQIVSALVSSHQHVDRSELPAIINDIGAALAALSPRIEGGMKSFTPEDLIEFRSMSALPLPDRSHSSIPATAPEPAVPVEESVLPSHLICLECGETAKVLRRHLFKMHKLTPDAYRSKYRLTFDYPMVAPDYAELRSNLAKASGLGKRKGAGKVGRKNGARREGVAK